MLPQHRVGHRSVSFILLLLVVVAGVAIAIINALSSAQATRTQLEERTRTIAYALDGDTIAQLSGTSADLQSPIYRDLKTKLTALKLVSTDARSVSLAGLREGEAFFYVDSEVPETQYYASPGEHFTGPVGILTDIVINKQPLVVGPTNNALAGMAPVISNKTGKVVAVVTSTTDATVYNQALLQGASLPLAATFIIVALILVYEWMRRRDQQLLRVRSELVSIASHELRSPVVGIRWASESLLKSAKGTSVGTVRAIYDSVIHLQASIEDILQLTHVTSHQAQKLNLAPCDMTALLHEVCDTQRLHAQQRGVALVMDKSWPKELIVTCDEDKMKRAFHNIVSNAVKYTQDKTEVALHYALKDSKHCIYIIDHGIGIPAAEQGRVFGGFYRATNAKASGVEGTGLGLYLTKTIITQHHGEVSFVSEEGLGTTFAVTLPG